MEADPPGWKERLVSLLLFPSEARRYIAGETFWNALSAFISAEHLAEWKVKARERSSTVVPAHWLQSHMDTAVAEWVRTGNYDAVISRLEEELRPKLWEQVGRYLPQASEQHQLETIKRSLGAAVYACHEQNQNEFERKTPPDQRKKGSSGTGPTERGR